MSTHLTKICEHVLVHRDYTLRHPSYWPTTKRSQAYHERADAELHMQDAVRVLTLRDIDHAYNEFTYEDMNEIASRLVGCSIFETTTGELMHSFKIECVHVEVPTENEGV